MTDDLVNWLRAQIDEDERIAQASMADRPWGLYPDGHSEATLAWLERWSEDRVLVEIDAKRRILEEIEKLAHSDVGAESTAMALIRALMLPYADRPGRRQERQV